MLLPNLHSALNNPNLKTLLVISESLDLLCLVEQLRPVDLQCWYHIETDIALGHFSVQGMGVDAFLLCSVESIQFWTGSKQMQLLNQTMIPDSISAQSLRQVKVKIQKDTPIVQAFQKRRLACIRSISSLMHTDFVRPKLSDARTATLFREAFRSTKEDHHWSLHPVQKGWELKRHDGYTIDNTELFDAFTKQLSSRRRGCIITTNQVQQNTSWIQVPSTEWYLACSNPNTIAGLGPNGEWISQIDYFPFHDPVLQLARTIEMTINIMRAFTIK